MTAIEHLLAAMLAVAISTGTSGDADIWQYEPVPKPVDQWVQVAEPPIVEPERCLIITYGWVQGSPRQTSVELTDNLEPWEIRVAIVGTYLWVQFDREVGTGDSQTDVSSIPLTVGSDRTEICRDL